VGLLSRARRRGVSFLEASGKKESPEGGNEPIGHHHRNPKLKEIIGGLAPLRVESCGCRGKKLSDRGGGAAFSKRMPENHPTWAKRLTGKRKN